MAACDSCGVDGTGRFCAECGQNLQAQENGVVLLDAAPAHPIESSASVQSGSSRLRWALLGSLLVVLVVLALSSIRDAPEDLALPAAEGAAEDVPESPATTAPSTTTDTTEPPADRDTEGPGSTATDTPGVPNGPVLGYAVPYYAVVNTFSGPKRVDLDTGDVVDLGLTDSILLGQAWGYLVLADRDGQIMAVAENSIASEPLTLGESAIVGLGSAESMSLRSGHRADRIWLVGGDSMVEMDLESQEQFRSVRNETGWVPWHGTTPELMSPPSGGVFQLDGSGRYRWVHEGRVLAEAPGRLLVLLCDEDLVCSRSWRDPVDFEEVEGYLAPEATLETMWEPVRSLPGDRYLVKQWSTVFDVQTGEEFELRDSEAELSYGGGLVIIPAAHDAGVATVLSSASSLGARPAGGGPSVNVAVRGFQTGTPLAVVKKSAPDDR